MRGDEGEMNGYTVVVEVNQAASSQRQAAFRCAQEYILTVSYLCNVVQRIIGESQENTKDSIVTRQEKVMIFIHKAYSCFQALVLSKLSRWILAQRRLVTNSNGFY
jgi:hypothetical protein